jgi:hypothetical protein
MRILEPAARYEEEIEAFYARFEQDLLEEGIDPWTFVDEEELISHAEDWLGRSLSPKQQRRFIEAWRASWEVLEPLGVRRVVFRFKKYGYSQVRYFIKGYRGAFGYERMCEIVGITKSWYKR